MNVLGLDGLVCKSESKKVRKQNAWCSCMNISGLDSLVKVKKVDIKSEKKLVKQVKVSVKTLV